METPEHTTAVRRLRVEIKLTEEQKALIERAAVVEHEGLSTFVRQAAERAAREILGEPDPPED